MQKVRLCVGHAHIERPKGVSKLQNAEMERNTETGMCVLRSVPDVPSGGNTGADALTPSSDTGRTDRP